VLERLKAIFKLKEQQDFRDLYTRPPISFAEDHPDVPKPNSPLSPEWLAVQWLGGDLHGEQMPELAVALLEAGYDTPMLRRLAGEIAHCRADVEELVEKVFRELGVAYPKSEREVKTLRSRQIAREVIAGKRNAWAAASVLLITIWDRETAEIPDLRIISELHDALDWDAVNHDKLPELTSELIATFARLGARQPGERQPIRLGLLQGKGWIADDFDGPLPEEILAQFEGREPNQS
jgi:hypothetical protein